MDHENLNTEETVDETIDPAPSAEQTEQPAAEAARKRLLWKAYSSSMMI